MSKIEKIIKRDGEIVFFHKNKISFAIQRAIVAVGGHTKGVAERISEQVVCLLERRNFRNSYPTVEEVQDLVEKCLIKAGQVKTAKAYIVYRYEHALKRAGKQSLTYSAENIPYKKLWEALSWAVDNKCVNLSQLAHYVEQGRLADLIRLAETNYDREIEKAVGAILERVEDIRIVIVAGPSSSGKTTTCLKIQQKLALQGKKLVALNLDNYFFDLDYHPQDMYGDYDFETPQALDLKLINRHIKQLLAGEEVVIPFYNFKKGRRDGSLKGVRIAADSIILIDSLHGMYPEMLAGIDPELKFNLYIETLSQMKDQSGTYIRWSDIRMLRRMVRDKQFRNYNPEQTLLHWRYVRRSELRYIISKLKEAHVIVNSFLPYELFILKSRLQEYFPVFEEKYKDSPEREDAFDRVRRINSLFAGLPAWEDESLVPPDSLLREFIGGSSYQY